MTARSAQMIRAEGVDLYVEAREGTGDPNLPVLLLHGFTGSAESLSEIAARLHPQFTTVLVDLVGHGRSAAPADPDAYSMQRCVAGLRSVLDALGAERVHLLGYSMGGRTALSFAVASDRRVASVLAVGASGGLHDDIVRQERFEADRVLAQHILDIGIERFVDEWMANPLFATQRRLGEAALGRARAERLRNRPTALAMSLRGMGTGAMEPIDFEKIGAPVCFAVGAEDEKFRAIACEIQAHHPEVLVEIIPEAGHAVHLENPEGLARLAHRFFAAAECAEVSSRMPQIDSANCEGRKA